MDIKTPIVIGIAGGASDLILLHKGRRNALQKCPLSFPSLSASPCALGDALPIRITLRYYFDATIGALEFPIPVRRRAELSSGELPFVDRFLALFAYASVPFANSIVLASTVYRNVMIGSGSGKTTVADAIVQVIGRDKIAFLHHDAYYRDLSHLTLEERALTNFDHPNSLETELLIEHLNQLKENKCAHTPIYDFKTHSRTKETILEEPRKVIVVEGILIFSEPELLKLLDIKIFVDTADDIRFIRRLDRDIKERGRTVESVIKQYYDTVRPMHMEFVEPSKRNADVIVPEGGYNRIAIEMITSHIHKVLSHSH